MDKHKIADLKVIARKYNLKISGTKSALLQRIQSHLAKENACNLIQRAFRGHIVRYLLANLGPAYKNHSMCVNECDGCTLDPLDTIPHQRLFSCTDNKGFIYGFDILSLLTMHKKCKTIINPYTREPMSPEMVNKIKTLGRLILLLFPEVVDKAERDVITSSYPSPVVIRRNTVRRTNSIPNNTPVTLYRPQYGAERNAYYRNIIFNTATTEPEGMDILFGTGLVRDYLTEQEQGILNKLLDVKKLPIVQRIREVFIEIDILGNYTQSSWFSTLAPQEYFHFFRHLYEIWNFRANLSSEIKNRICVLYDPFLNIRLPPTGAILVNPVVQEPHMREICTTVIENIVYGSPDPEYRKIGAMHVLTALTLVSREARHQLYWLYESVI